jgi:XrtJ-associated TM-motif-TM protein
MSRRFCLLLAMLLLAFVVPARATDGCDDSPESPTIVLALVGGIGAIATGLRVKCRRKS